MTGHAVFETWPTLGGTILSHSNMALYNPTFRFYFIRFRPNMARSAHPTQPMSTTVTPSRPTDPPRPLPAQPGGATLVLVAFAAVYLIWGSTYLAIRVGVESFPPLLLAGSRHLLTGLILYPILRWKTGGGPTPAHW